MGAFSARRDLAGGSNAPHGSPNSAAIGPRSVRVRRTRLCHQVRASRPLKIDKTEIVPLSSGVIVVRPGWRPPLWEVTGVGALSSTVTALFFRTFFVTAVTVARNGYTCGSHALYVCQGCQAACLSCIGPIQWRLVNSSAVVFTHLSLRSSTVPTASVASFDDH